jgi:ribosomal protein L11 methylase PrmA
LTDFFLLVSKTSVIKPSTVVNVVFPAPWWGYRQFYVEMEGVVLERVDLGPVIGDIDLYQVEQRLFNGLCLQENSVDSDSTGLRAYSGAHVLCRFLVSQLGVSLTQGRNVVELGCGCGVVGSAAHYSTKFRSLLLTDGSDNACDIANLNIKKLFHSTTPNSTTSIYSSAADVDDLDHSFAGARCAKLYWSQDLSDVHRFLDLHNNGGQKFDVVLGCELMYYKTNLKALLATVRLLILL